MQNIRNWMEANNLSIRDVAGIVGKSVAAVSRKLNGLRKWTVYEAALLIAASDGALKPNDFVKQ